MAPPRRYVSGDAVVRVVVPAFNEGRAVVRLVDRLFETLGAAGLQHGVIVVDDASTDGTGEALEAAHARGPLTIVRSPVNLGYGGALDEGIRHALREAADDDLIVTMDGDDTHPPELIPAMLDLVRDGASVVVASRYARGARTRGYSRSRRAVSWTGNSLYRWLTPIGGPTETISDYTNGYRAYAARFLAEAFRDAGGRLFQARDFSATTELLLALSARPGARIRELPFTYRYDRKSATSKLDVWATARRHLGLIQRTVRGRTALPTAPPR